MFYNCPCIATDAAGLEGGGDERSLWARNGDVSDSELMSSGGSYEHLDSRLDDELAGRGGKRGVDALNDSLASVTPYTSSSTSSSSSCSAVSDADDSLISEARDDAADNWRLATRSRPETDFVLRQRDRDRLRFVGGLRDRQTAGADYRRFGGKEVAIGRVRPSVRCFHSDFFLTN